MMLVLSLIFSLLFQPEQPTPWMRGCHPDVLPHLQTAVGYPEFDYDQACEVIFQCGGADWATCELRVIPLLEQGCLAEDTQCKNMAALTAFALNIFYIPELEDKPDAALLEGMVNVLTAFRSGDYAAALADYERFPVNAYNSHSILFGSIIIYRQMGAPDQALELVTSGAYPTIRYFRAWVYGDLGREIEASFDVEWLRQYALNDPQLTAAFQPLIDLYPLDAEHFETWMAYPVMNYASSMSSSSVKDLSQLPPFAVQIGDYPEFGGIFVVGLVYGIETIDYGMPFPDAFFLKSEAAGYSNTLPEPVVQLQRTDSEVLVVLSEYRTFEAGARPYFLLAPADAPDPRQDLLGQSCEGGVTSRLRSGMIVAAETDHLPEVTVYDTPAGKIIGDTATPFTVIENRCLDGVVWWYGQTYDGTVGWIKENHQQTYYLRPQSDYEQRLLYCPQALTPRLSVGATGQVVGETGTNDLRLSADMDAEIVGQLPEDVEFQVIGGAVCADGMVWWQVESNGVQGWTAEGQANAYWLEPSNLVHP